MDGKTRADMIAALARDWYEKHREGWWARCRPGSDRSGAHADEFMLAFTQYVGHLYFVGADALRKEHARLRKNP
jgi:hypothetical protein